MTRLAELIEEYNEMPLEPGEPAMTIRRLAEVSEVPERTVYRHVNGETTMSLDQAAAYARALKRQVDDLVAA